LKNVWKINRLNKNNISTLDNAFRSLRNVLLKERKELPKEKQWSVFTMFVYSTGKFTSNYEYGDVSETFIEYQKNWEKKYIYNT
jgi:hypothetical protein